MNQTETPSTAPSTTTPANQVPVNQKPANAARVQYSRPLANVVETADGFTLEVELPGVSRENLEIAVNHGELQVTGARTSAATATLGESVYRESRGWDYRRTFELDPSIDTAGITAKLEQGVLNLHLPKAESRKPRKIEVAA